MALNEFMHPRNIYKKKKPDFQALALKYPEFRKFVYPDVTGKLFLDFKHPDSLRQLTLTLLREDFKLDLELPLDRLIPTVPLRLNYIHWIEDILTGSKTGQNGKGIDIGTGASCIYPLLVCRLHTKWSVLASEVDDQNYIFAQRNIERNKMEERITVKKVVDDQSSVLCDVVKDETDRYDFCMCNPPFFADHVEAQAVAKSRSYSRSDPKSVCTASFTESIVEGGEVMFVKRMIKDSLDLRTKIRVYTSMVGKKTSLPPLKEELRRLQVPKFTTTEFCQGKTMRWGLAWTFDTTVNFPKSLFQESRKERIPLVYQVPDSGPDYTVQGITTRLQALLDQLKIQFSVTMNQQALVTMTLVAKGNTWCHQRRRRRQEKLRKLEEQTASSTSSTRADTKETDVLNINKDSSSSRRTGEELFSGGTLSLQQSAFCQETSIQDSKGANETDSGDKDNSQVNPSIINDKVSTENSDSGEGSGHVTSDAEVATQGSHKDNDGSSSNTITSQLIVGGMKRNRSETKQGESDSEEHVTKKRQISTPTDCCHGDTLATTPSTSVDKKWEILMSDKTSSEEMVNGYSELFEESTEEKVYLTCSLKVKRSSPHVVMEMTWIDGENRESMHQVLQYLKNKLTVPPSLSQQSTAS